MASSFDHVLHCETSLFLFANTLLLLFYLSGPTLYAVSDLFIYSLLNEHISLRLFFEFASSLSLHGGFHIALS